MRIEPILKRLYKDKKLSIPQTTSSQIIEMVKTSKETDSNLLSRIKGLNAQNSDLEQLAYLLTKDEQTIKHGFKLFKLSGMNGSLKGEFQHAKLVSSGFNGFQPNPDKGLEMIKQLARKGYTQAEYVLALHYIKLKRLNQAHELLQLTSAKNHGPSNAILGSISN